MKPNWRYSPIARAAAAARSKAWPHATTTSKCLFFRPRSTYQTLQTNIQRRLRATCLPAAGGRLQFAPDLWSATGKIVTTANIKTWPHRHRFTAEEYNWMAEIGLLNGEPAVELVEREIIHMATMGTQHGNVVQRLHTALKAALAGRALINIQRVFRLSNITEAQPDLIVLKPGSDYHSAKFPTGRDTLLVLEVR